MFINKKKFQELSIKVSSFIKRYGKIVAIQALFFLVIATISGGVLWWRLKSLNDNYIALPPLEDPIDNIVPEEHSGEHTNSNDFAINNDVVINSNKDDIEITPENNDQAVIVTLPEPQWQWPIESEIVKEYGVVFWPTLNDWRMHEGIDLLVKKDSAISVAADGRVESIITTEKWGTKIVVVHGSNYSTIYAAQGTTLVNVGEQVLAGQDIFRVENSSKIEEALPLHLHFVIMLNGDSLRPAKVLPIIS